MIIGVPRFHYLMRGLQGRAGLSLTTPTPTPIKQYILHLLSPPPDGVSGLHPLLLVTETTLCTRRSIIVWDRVVPRSWDILDLCFFF